MTAEQWLDWALSVVTVHEPPRPQARERMALNPEYAKNLIEGLYENGDPVSVDAAELLEKLIKE